MARKQKTSKLGSEKRKQSKKDLPDNLLLDSYDYESNSLKINVKIIKYRQDYVPTYELGIYQVGSATEKILERIRKELVKVLSFNIKDIKSSLEKAGVEEAFRKTITLLIDKYFPNIDQETRKFLVTYLTIRSVGLGYIQFLLDDKNLEEIVVNNSKEPVWVYHRKHGWLKTNLFLESEDQIKNYSSIIARKVGRQITILEPLLDAHLGAGDRVNATLFPISTHGNTITIRKFSRDPWTITRLLQNKTLTIEAAALIWLAIQYELSALIAGGTASGKTSMLNSLSNFFPPNQRIISIEDTRELQLPRFLHWVPLNTRLPNQEGKGEITMLDLLVNSLRMRPDRILVGEVRRKREAEVLFEAIHTGHSVYATIHANTAQETVERLTNPPIEVPKNLLSALSLIIVQYRNRRTGKRRTFQIAEVLPKGDVNILMQYDPNKDKLVWKNKSKALFQTLKMFTGFSDAAIKRELEEKQKVLNYLVKFNITDVDSVGKIFAEYYTNKEELLDMISKHI